MKEVLGENGLNAVLNTARLSHYVDSYPPADFSPGMTFEETGRLFEAVEGMFGQRAGRRLARQSGRICFQFGIEGFGAVIGFMDFVLRILPMSLRARIGLEVLSEILNRYSDQHVVLDGDDENYYFEVVPCGICWGRYASVLCWSGLWRKFYIGSAVGGTLMWRRLRALRRVTLRVPCACRRRPYVDGFALDTLGSNENPWGIGNCAKNHPT